MQRQTGTIVDALGRPAQNCAVTVLAADGTTPTLWSDNGITALGSNVVTTNARGFYDFYARNGVYQLQLAKTGYSAVNADLNAVLLYDPYDSDHPQAEGGMGRLLGCDFLSLFKVGRVGLTDGAALELPTSTGQVNLKAPTSVFRNGWLECVSDGTAQPETPYVAFEESGAPATRSWGYVPTAPDKLIVETSLVSVGSSASAVRRFGLSDSGLQNSAAPANGIYLEQTNEAPTGALVLIARASSTQSSAGFLPVGQALTATTPLPLRFVITSTRVDVYALGAVPAVATVTSNIPATSTLLYLLGGSTLNTVGIGFAVDYVRAMMVRG